MTTAQTIDHIPDEAPLKFDSYDIKIALNAVKYHEEKEKAEVLLLAQQNKLLKERLDNMKVAKNAIQ